MNLISKIRGNPFDRLKPEQLDMEKIKFERREKLLMGDILRIEQRKKNLFESGFGKSNAEQRILVRQIDETDKQLKLKQIQLKRLSDRIKVVDQFRFILENRQFLEESGLMRMISKIPKTKLETFLSQVNLADTVRTGKVTKVLQMMEDNYGLVGEIEDDAATQSLLEMWNSDIDSPTTDLYESWNQTRRETESLG